MRFICDYERDIAACQWSTALCIRLNAAPSESMWLRSQNRWDGAAIILVCFVDLKVDGENLGCRVYSSAAITEAGTVYSAWKGALWLVERIYCILQRRETGVCRRLEKKGENMRE